jgi:hypothetical protein
MGNAADHSVFGSDTHGLAVFLVPVLKELSGDRLGPVEWLGEVVEWSNGQVVEWKSGAKAGKAWVGRLVERGALNWRGKHGKQGKDERRGKRGAGLLC